MSLWICTACKALASFHADMRCPSCGGGLEFATVMPPTPDPPVTPWMRCPVCDGRGNLPTGFYLPPTPDGTFTAYDTAPELCRTCNGQGVIRV